MNRASEQWANYVRTSSFRSTLSALGRSEEEFWHQFDAADMMNDYAGYPSDICAWIRQRVPRGSTFADVGCGSGRYVHALVSRCSCIYAIDPSPSQLGRAMSGAVPAYRERYRFIGATWEEAVIPPVDFVLAAYSFLVEDIISFLRKLLDWSVCGTFIVFRAGPGDAVRTTPVPPSCSCDYATLEAVLKDEGHVPEVALFSRDYAVPYALYQRAYAWYLPDTFDLRAALVVEGRLENSGGHDLVRCRRQDACLYVDKSR